MWKVLTILSVSWTLTAAMKPEHSSVETKITTEANKNQKIEFKVLTKGAIVINDDKDVPWQLSITNPNGITFPKTEYVKADYSAATPGFSITTVAPPKGKAWSFDYKLIAFICTKSKDKCYREVHKGSVAQK